MAGGYGSERLSLYSACITEPCRRFLAGGMPVYFAAALNTGLR